MTMRVVDDKPIVGEVKKVYDIQEAFKNTLKIESISKDSYFMNLGQTILMFSKGYLVDRVYINIKVEGTVLKYFGDKKLIHISPKQIDFYKVEIDMGSNPPKLKIDSFDSITNV